MLKVENHGIVGAIPFAQVGWVERLLGAWACTPVLCTTDNRIGSFYSEDLSWFHSL